MSSIAMSLWPVTLNAVVMAIMIIITTTIIIIRVIIINIECLKVTPENNIADGDVTLAGDIFFGFVFVFVCVFVIVKC